MRRLVSKFADFLFLPVAALGMIVVLASLKLHHWAWDYDEEPER